VSIEPMPVIPVEDWQRTTLIEGLKLHPTRGFWLGPFVFWHRSRWGWLRTGLAIRWLRAEDALYWVSAYTGTRARLANFSDER